MTETVAVDLCVVDHPLIKAWMTVLRDETTSNTDFRSALARLSQMLVYEALASAPIDEVDVQTPVAVAPGARLRQAPLFVPVLRAGLGMLDAALGTVPDAKIGFVGMARDEETAEPVEYLASIPADLTGQPVYVLDPMLATGGSLIATLDLLAARGATDLTAVCVVAAPEGVQALRDSGRPIRLLVAALDERLDDASFIVPGLGDAGDRQFGPR